MPDNVDRATWRSSPASTTSTSPYGTTVPLLDDVKSQVPQAICVLTSTNVSRNLILNRRSRRSTTPNLRRAMALSLDRKAFIDII